MTERLIPVDGGELCVEGFGQDADAAILLIGGMAQSMDWWDVALCQLLADGGRFVIRYDHRDTGRSSASPAGAPSYSAHDLMLDPLRILDAARHQERPPGRHLDGRRHHPSTGRPPP